MPTTPKADKGNGSSFYSSSPVLSYQYRFSFLRSARTLRSDAAVYIAHDSTLLPHLHLPEDIATLFEEAIPDPPRRGEEDVDPIIELSDPVPALQALINRRRRLIDGAGADPEPEGEALVETIEPR